jgi:hypothetical protein
MIIAQPFMAGKTAIPFSKSRQGRQNISSVPDGTLEVCGQRIPALKGWAIFKENRVILYIVFKAIFHLLFPGGRRKKAIVSINSN